MPKITFELSDEDDEGQVSFNITFDPPLEDPDALLTPAQGEAALLIEIMQRRAQGQTLKQIADEVNDDEYGRLAGGYEPGEPVWTQPEETEGNN